MFKLSIILYEYKPCFVLDGHGVELFTFTAHYEGRHVTLPRHNFSLRSTIYIKIMQFQYETPFAAKTVPLLIRSYVIKYILELNDYYFIQMSKDGDIFSKCIYPELL